MTKISKVENNDMNTLSEIGNRLRNADNILIFPHGSIDGDALGSSVALCLGLRSLGKISYVVIDESIPENIRFIEHGCTSDNLDIIPNPDVNICIDNGDITRLFSRQELFNKAKTTVLIDHHKSSKSFLNMNYIDVLSAAAAEIVYDLLLLMDVQITQPMAESIYTGIVTDTGRFQYSNTTRRTHEIVADLMDCGIDQNKVSVEVYQSESPAKLKLQASVLNTLRMESNGKVAIAMMTLKMLADAGAKDEETEGVVEKLRNIRGVEIAVFVKENSKEGIKVSMRSKYNFDVSMIAQEFGGGGHKKAAGFTSSDPIDKVIGDLIEAISRAR